MNYFLIFFTSFFLPYTFTIPIPFNPLQSSTEDENFMEVYLNKFYPVPEKKGHNMEEQLKDMQKFFHLEVTGKMNAKTMEVMKRPRCGVPDALQYRSRRPLRWRSNMLTYRINNYTPDMPQANVDEAIVKAFKVWSDVTPLLFRRTYRRSADIEIWFAFWAHGDNSPFDGKGEVLAHAYFPGPGIGGDTHFDESEKWSEYNRATSSNDGTAGLNFFCCWLVCTSILYVMTQAVSSSAKQRWSYEG